MIGKSENVSEKKTKQNKPIRDKVKTVCWAVVSFLMISVIVINVILIIKIYIFKQAAPDVFGFFPLISLTDEASPRIEIGDLVLCRKIDYDDSGEIKEKELVAHFPINRRDMMYISTVVSVDGDTVTLRAPNDNENKTFELAADDVIGRFRMSIPILGYIIYFLSTIPGFLICVVIPTIVLTEIYLYKRRKDFAMADDEESLLLAELEALKAERERLLEQSKEQTPESEKENYVIR